MNIPGMGNMGAVLKQAKQMQEKMKKAQAELEEKTFKGSAGQGAVRVIVNGKKEVISITISPEIVDKDDIETLEDLVSIAVNDALKKAEDASQSELNSLAGGLNIPGLFN
jgi:DNA-binding YbaB/EbfC family protein